LEGASILEGGRACYNDDVRGKRLHRVDAGASRAGGSVARSALAVAALAGAFSTGVARGESPPVGVAADATAQEGAPARPSFSAAVGAGMSRDGQGRRPAFFATGGVGADRLVGLELGALSTAVSGVSAGQAPSVDRLGLDAYAVVHPFVLTLRPESSHLKALVARALGVELGLGLERDSLSTRSGSRWGLHTGVRLEVPVPLPGGASDLFVRLAVRRLVGLYTPELDTTDVHDSRELLAAVASVF
jgi:hypothetical protein